MTQSDSGELTGSEYRKSMAVSGNTVHIAVTDYNYAENGTGRLYYFRSDNNGVAFSEGTVIDMIDGYNRIRNSQIRAMGEQVVIAYKKELYRASELYAAVSTDSGKNFKRTWSIKVRPKHMPPHSMTCILTEVIFTSCMVIIRGT